MLKIIIKHIVGDRTGEDCHLLQKPESLRKTAGRSQKGVIRLYILYMELNAFKNVLMDFLQVEMVLMCAQLSIYKL